MKIDVKRALSLLLHKGGAKENAPLHFSTFARINFEPRKPVIARTSKSLGIRREKRRERAKVCVREVEDKI